MIKNKLDLNHLEKISGGDLNDDAKALKKAQTPHIHQFFTTGRDADGVRIDKCAVCNMLKYYLPDGNEITEMEYKIRKMDFHI